MNTMKEALFDLVIKRPFLVIFGVLLLVMAAGFGVSKLTFKSDYRVFFGEENPQLTAFESIQSTFTKNDNVAFVIVPKDGVVFKQTTLEAIHWLTSESWQIPYSSRVDSVTNYQHTVAEGDDLLVGDLVLEPELLPELNLKELESIVLGEPILQNKLISGDASVTVVNTTIQLPGIDPAAELPEVVAKVREIKTQFLAAYPDHDVYLSGVAMMNNTFTESALRDQATLFPVMLFLVIPLIMLILLRTISGTIATFVIVIVSIAATMGLVGWLGFYMTGPSSSAPTIILTLAVADSIHILTSMLYEMRHGMEKRKAIVESLRINLQPVFLTSITTAVGFLSLNFSDSPPFNDLGNFVAIGVMLAFVFSITLFPALLSVLPFKVAIKAEGHNDTMDKLAEFVINKRKILLPAFTVLIIGLAVFVPQNALNDNFVEYFDTSVLFRQATDFMEEHLSGLTTFEIEVDSKESSGINKPEYLQVLANFSDWVRQQPETDNVSIISDIIRRLNKNMHGDDPSWYRLPEDRELAAQYLLLYELSLPYGLDLNNQIDVDKASTRIIVTAQNKTSKENIEFESRIKRWFEENAPEYEVKLASPMLMFSHIGQRNIQSMLTGTILALILISVLLAIALRSITFGLISLIPNFVPATMGLGLWYFIDGEVGLAISAVIGVTLGIVVDDTVHFLSKYLRARRLKQKDSEAAVRYAFASVGRALWITTFVLIAGFMVLAQSSFNVNADMGLLISIVIAIALIMDFLFLPPLLMKLDGGMKASSAGSGISDRKNQH